jgi:hypothetical protein
MAGECHLDSHKHLDDPHLFLTKFGRGMGPRSIQQMVETYLATTSGTYAGHIVGQPEAMSEHECFGAAVSITNLPAAQPDVGWPRSSGWTCRL